LLTADVQDGERLFTVALP